MELNKFKNKLLHIYNKFPEFKDIIEKSNDEYITFLYLHLNENIKIDISTKVKKRKTNLLSKKITCGEKYCKVIDIIYGKFLNENEKNIINNTEFYVTCYEEQYAKRESDNYFKEKNRRDFLLPCFFHEKTIEFLNNINYKDNMEYNNKFTKFHILLGKIRKYIKTKERLGIMIDSSFTLKTHNIRKNKDIDLVILHPNYNNKKVKNNLKYKIAKKLKFIDAYFPNIHVDWIQKTKKRIDENTKLITSNKLQDYNEIVFNPNYHYYFFGIKVIILDYDLGYRAHRRFPKNVADLILTKHKLNINIPKIKKLEKKIKVDNNIYTPKQFIEKVQKYLNKFGKNMDYDTVKKEIEELY
jgi:hypothetical protein